MKNEKLINKLKKEQAKLDKKLLKLASFIADQQDSQTISKYHLNLLREQLNAMWKYSEVLTMRISDLEENGDND